MAALGKAIPLITREKVCKVSIATQTVNMAFDPETPSANQNGTVLEAVTKDQVNTGLTGQIRYRVSDKNLYASIFGVKRPIVHMIVDNTLTS